MDLQQLLHCFRHFFTWITSKVQALLNIVMTTSFDDSVNLQSQSAIFSHIPAEIRNQIFSLALTADDDKEKPYTPYSYYYRPGYLYSHKIHTNLLLTCRRIYLEARLLPLSIHEHTGWFFRGPLGLSQKFLPVEKNKRTDIRRTYEECLKKDQLSAICKVHLFTQQFWLEDTWGDKRGWPFFTQKWSDLTHIKITVRHTDWWYWESAAPLAMDAKRAGRAKPNDWIDVSNPFEAGSWGAAFRNFQALKKFVLELETIERKKNELDKIVPHASNWQFMLGNGNVMALNESETKRNGWVGSRYFSGKPEPPRSRRWGRGPQQDHPSASSENSARTSLAVAGVIFDELSEPVASLAPNEVLTYYVVTLTWRTSARQVEMTKG